MTDFFKTYTTNLTAPGTHAFAIVPSDSADLPMVTRGVYVGQAGDLSAILNDDDAPVTFAGLLTGVLYLLRLRRVLATGTTSGALVGIY